MNNENELDSKNIYSKNIYSKNMINHLGRLSDGIFALSMALSIFNFDFPDSITSMTSTEVNHFLLRSCTSPYKL